MSEQKIAYYLSFSDVIRVLRLVDETPFQELQLELEGLSVRVVQDKDKHAPRCIGAPSTPAGAASAANVAASTSAADAAPAVPAADGAPAETADEAIASVAAVMSVAMVGSAEAKAVVAPLAGTFYRAPAPGAAPFVEIGKSVKEGDVVGILEIMKLMNHVTAPCAGVISRICAKNEEFVEFGQVLALIDPLKLK